MLVGDLVCFAFQTCVLGLQILYWRCPVHIPGFQIISWAGSLKVAWVQTWL